jgi:hypothetical protein
MRVHKYIYIFFKRVFYNILSDCHNSDEINKLLNAFRFRFSLELVSKELNHFGVIAGLFRQIGGHSSRFVLFCYF